jgi:hypothetical protein
MTKEREYEKLTTLEQETTRIRHQTFTAILAVSFVVPGLATKVDDTSLDTGLVSVSLSQLVFLLGYVFYLFACFHYAWHHRYAHLYRKALKDIEKNDLDIKIYRLRERLCIGKDEKYKFHFDWALYIIAVFYGLLTAHFVGWRLLLCTVGFLLVAYTIPLFVSRWRPREPHEKDRAPRKRPAENLAP